MSRNLVQFVSACLVMVVVLFEAAVVVIIMPLMIAGGAGVPGILALALTAALAGALIYGLVTFSRRVTIA